MHYVISNIKSCIYLIALAVKALSDYRVSVLGINPTVII